MGTVSAGAYARTIFRIVAGLLTTALIMAMAPTAQAAKPTVTNCSKSGRYLAEYFKGTSFKGRPAKARCESSIKETYRSGAKPSGVNVGPRNFSVRWTKLAKLSSASYDFRTKADDTVRIRLDSKTLISQKKHGTYRSAVKRVKKGTHRLTVEYTQKSGAGYISVDVLKGTDRKAPSKPRSVVAKAGSERATVSWKGAGQLDLRGYYVYRSTSSKVSTKGKPVSGSKPTTKTSFTDKGAKSPTSYYYAVVSVDHRGNKSSAARSNKVTPKDKTAPRTPRGLKVKGGDARASLTWSANPESDLRDYRVYRATGTGKPRLIATVSKSKRSYTDTKLANATTYVYSLAAVDKAGNISSRSSGVSARPTDKTAPAKPSGLKATGRDGRVLLTWNANKDKDLALYQVLRSTGSGSYTRIATVARPGNTFIDAAVKNGTTYRYVITAVDTTGNISSRSSSVSAKPTDTTAPAAPAGVKATADDGTVTLTWDANDESDLKDYQVFRTTGGKITRVATVAKSIRSFTDRDVQNGTTYLYFVTAVDSAGNASGPSAVVAANPIDTKAPDAPEGLRAKAGDGAVVLTWQPNSDGDLASYQIFRTATAGLKGLAVAEPEPLATVEAGTETYTDETAKNGTAYSYTLRAVDKAGNVSQPSAAALATPVDESAPAAPQNLDAEAAEGRITVTWSPNGESDLDTYVLYRSVGGAEPAKAATIQAGTHSYADEDVSEGSSYAYTLVAVDKAGNPSAPSKPATATLADTTAPEAPRNLVAEAGDGEVSLSWDANTESDLAEYRILRDDEEIAVVAAGTEAYVDGTVTNGTSYDYHVVAVDEAANESQPSGKASAEPTDQTAPAAPTSLTATASEGKITLTWDANEEEDLNEYQVFRSDGAATPVELTTVAAGTTTYTDSDVTNGMAYTYLIKAIDNDGNESEASNTATAEPVDSTDPATPTNLKATAGDAAVSLTWDANDDEDLKAYQVFRAEGSDQATMIAEVLKGTESFSDTEVENKVAYTYHLVAVDVAGNLSEESDPVTVTPADSTAPAVPTGLEAIAGDATVELSWDANTETDLVGYQVLRSNGTTAPEEIASVTEPTYTDSDVINGITYRYQVVAVDKNENASAPSAVTEAAPEGVPVEPINEKFSFTTAADAKVPAGYTKNSGAAWSDQAGLGWVSEESLDSATHAPLDLTKNTRVRTRTTVSDLQNRLIHLQYGTSIEPNPTNGELKSGAFELAVADGWYAVTVSVGDQGGGANAWDSLHSVNAEGSSVIDKFQGTAAKEYRVAGKTVEVTDGRLTIDALGGKNTKINYLEVESTEAPDTEAPEAPQGLTGEAGDGSVELGWDAVASEDLDGYRVYRADSADVPTTGDGIGGSDPLTATTFTDQTVTNGNTYHYVVVAVDKSGNSSEASAAVEAKPEGATPEPLNEKVSFTTTADTAVPDGYTKNTGAAWTDSAGLGWVTEASLSSASHEPLDLTKNTRVRTQSGVSALQNRLIHMQYGTIADPNAANGTLTSGAFELAAPDGWYEVTVSVGDEKGGTPYNSQHSINVEGMAAVNRFQGSDAKQFQTATVTAQVSDGRLTIDALGGTNTKLNYLEVISADEPVEPEIAQKINFGDAGTIPPAGYLADHGQSYGPRTGTDQGTAHTYGWVALSDGTPVNLSENGRNRITDKQAPAGTDPRLASFIHMQLPDNAASGTKTPGSWEMAVPDGSYAVTVAVGDAGTAIDSVHWINVESQNAIAGYVPTGAAGSAGHHTTATLSVTVTDGRLTISPQAGTNTKIDYVTIDSVAGSSNRPAVLKSTPGNLATGVSLTGSVVADLTLRGGGVDPSTLKADTAKLIKVSDGSQVDANTITSGGADVINVSPKEELEPDTTYRFEVTAGVKDVDGRSFLPYTSVFTTGSGDSTGGPIAFTKSDSGAASVGGGYTSVVKGPDGRMYAGSIMGDIYRFDIAADGKLTNRKTISTVRTYSSSAASGDTYNKGTRTVIGMAFDPKSTASAPILWISDNAPFLGPSNVPDFSGRIAKLSGPDLGTYTAVVDGLPRSVKDHESNSVAFGPDGALYLNQGANNAMGAPDGAWANRHETVLSAAVLRLDPSKVGDDTVDVRTNDAGSYDPFAADAPLTIHARGVRNAFDLLWHSNGHLYVPTNGSAAGGNVPAVPDTLPETCKTRPDGGYTGPKVAKQDNNPEETDYVFDVRKDKYYGHPNPARCEYILNAGNPTAAKDAFENSKYPVGTQADPNYDAANVYDAGLHASANGVIEYEGNAFGGALKGKLIYVRYSSGQDLVTFDVAANGKLSKRTTGITGFTGFNQPLDVGQDPESGNLYVTQLGNGTIALVKPQGGSDDAVAQVTDRLVFSSQNTVASPGLNVVVKNAGSQPLTIPAGGLKLAGDGASQFVLTAPSLPATVAPNASINVPVSFKPTSAGVKAASVTINTNAGNKTTVLRGLAAPGVSGGNEPSLQRIFDTYQLGIASGDPNPNDSGMPDTQGPIGDEVTAPVFVKAAFDKPISITPIAAYAPQETEPAIKVGWYEAGKASGVHEQFTVKESEAQSLMINPTGKTDDIDPGEETQFGFYSEYPSFNNRRVFTEPALNTWDTAKPHKVRVYPLKDADGVVEPNAYVLATEEIPGSFDNQDIVLIVRNVKPYVPTTVPGAELQAVNPDASPFADQIAFNRIQTPANDSQKVADTGTVKISNTGTAAMQVTGLPITGQFELVDPPTVPFELAPGASKTVTVKFVAQSTKVHNGTLTVQSNAAKNPTQVIHLGGLWQSVSEGGQEPGMAQVARAFGAGTTIPANLNGNGKVEKVGDEVLSPYWERLDGSKPVAVKQLAGYHTYPNGATVFRHDKGSNATTTIAAMDGLWAQSLLPHKQGANTQLTTGSFTPGATPFGFKIDPEWSDPTKNDSEVDIANGCVAPCGHHLRFFPVEDRTGERLPGAYFMTMDYSGINYDYQDNIYLVQNIKPEFLEMPDGLVAVPGDNEVNLSWSPTFDAAGYRIWRGTSPSVTADNGERISGAEPLTEPHFTDTTAKNGTTYYYVLRSVIPGSDNSESTPVVSATPTATPAEVNAKIDFGNEAAPLGGTGYLKDFGQAFGNRTGSDQGTGLIFGWVAEDGRSPLNLSVGGTTGPGNGRERKLQADKRLDTIMHMQGDDVPDFNGTPIAGVWEIAVPNGSYEVTVAVGDPAANSDPEVHTLNVEGESAVKDFVPTGAAGSITHHKTATVEVTVTDGRLTLDAVGGTNTKIDYVDILSVG